MLWRTVRAYFLPSAHPALRAIRERGGEELFPKVDEWGRRVEAEEGEGVWEIYRADRRRAYNRAVVRPYMGRYVRRWLGLGAVLFLLSRGLAAAGLGWPATGLLVPAGLALLVTLMLLLLWEEIR